MGTKEIKHRGFTIITYASGDGSWLIYSQLGHAVGGSFSSEVAAKEHVDELLDEKTFIRTLRINSTCSWLNKRGR